MEILKTLLIVYMDLSFLEWYIHRYLMNTSNNETINKINYPIIYIYSSLRKLDQITTHVKHHGIVNTDGSVKSKDKGMYYSVYNICFTPLLAFPLYYLTTKVINYKHTSNEYLFMISFFYFISYLYYSLWNILHPSYHNYLDKGYNSYMKGNCVYKYLERYHMLHHFNKGEDKCNFNIILPGADFIFGTYKGYVDNIDYYKSKTKKTKKDIEIFNAQIQKKPLPYGLKYK